MKLPKVITHKTAGPIRAAIAALPAMQPGRHEEPLPEWATQPVTLEVPIGELAEDGLKTLALTGGRMPAVCAIEGNEGFAAQGLEGKVQIRKPLHNALANLDLVPEHRARIVLRVVVLLLLLCGRAALPAAHVARAEAALASGR